jgi:1,4-dihydroxy-6-naphthoate synthase
MNAKRLRVAISTCPNDTFAFHGLLERCVDAHGIEFDFRLGDVQELNELLARGEVDVAKASFHAALRLADRYGVLPAGAALGFGNGPLLLAAREGDSPARPRDDGRPARVLAPGADTTATLLYRLFHAGEGVVEQTVFDRIMPVLARGDADFGVCIHEARFTYREHGVFLVEDLGARWERETQSPLPLGGILARLDLGADVHHRLAAAIRDSIDYARTHRNEALATMRRYAQETADDVLWKHVELYVNDFTRDLGDVGRAALGRLDAIARERGIVAGHTALRVL